MGWKRNGKETGNASFGVALDKWKGEIHFQYAPIQYQSGERKIFDYAVTLTATPCHFGGKRWWFLCPSLACNWRALKLYLIDGEGFGCRHCYRLTYASAQEHDKRVDALLKDPESLMRAVKRFNFLNMDLVTTKAAFKLDRTYKPKRRWSGRRWRSVRWDPDTFW